MHAESIDSIREISRNQTDKQKQKMKDKNHLSKTYPRELTQKIKPYNVGSYQIARKTNCPNKLNNYYPYS